MISTNLSGTLLAGRFQLLERLGEGAVGEVYLAEHLVLHRRHAIKVLKPQFQTDARLMERFRREAASASRLEHPNIVYISDFGQAEGGQLYRAMEYVEGVTLDDLIESALPGVLPLRRVFGLLDQVADAMAAAHAVDVVHRDLKPENIMVHTPRHGSEQVKVLDFGLAKIMVDSELYRLTRRGEIFGTPMYMSPEQARGESLDPRTDIYSFGCIAYEALCGHPPIMGGSLEEIIIANQRQAPTPVAVARPATAPPLPEGLEDVVMACLAKDRAARPARMVDVQERLAACRELLLRPARSHLGLEELGPPSGSYPVSRPETASRLAAPPFDRARAARIAVKDPWQWRQVVRCTRELADVLMARLREPDVVADLRACLAELDRSDAALEELEGLLDGPSLRLREAEQAVAQRAAALRHALIDLGMDRSRGVDAGTLDAAGLADLDFQIHALEERLAEVYAESVQVTAGPGREVADLEGRRADLREERVPTELRLITLAMASRVDRHALRAKPIYDELDGLITAGQETDARS
jgi:serine/threonine protein kinase